MPLKSTHYLRVFRDEPTKAYRRVKNGWKVCSKCEVNRPVTEYHKRNNGQVASACKHCLNAISRQNYQRRKARQTCPSRDRN